MEQISEDQSQPQKAPRLVPPPVLGKKLSKPQRSLQYHMMEQKISSAVTDYKAGKYASLAEAGRAHEITERAGYFRLRARAAGRASKSDRLKNGSQRLSPEQEITLCQYVGGLGDNRIMASRQKPPTSPMYGEISDEIASPIPREEVRSMEMTNEEPHFLLDCQRFLDRPTEADVTPSQISTTHTAPAESQNVLIIASGTDSIDRVAASPTATPPDRPSMGCSATNSFFSSIKSSLAEQKMTFSSRPT
ncbi:hypothetical protein E4T38_09398 [Aureobasidium subglaciale]|nr:hypothetical protein E4T38_09398 [Aureobasidium subglaciale]KAI5213936.1 hypothetical protein E4T40_09349 [Aureobasidium subglaciale]KAI5216256.1 hypothetical protein E4T41_09350 [Aureobasidium subglaciale]KAI5254149.1 hypothetical protein E4T46_09305 [Aureobasidium subglaciale]